MPRKTREQKIIADLRKQLQLREGVVPETRQAAPRISVAETVSLPESPIPQVEIKKEANYSYLKKDLLKVGGLVGAAVILEFIISFLVASGVLKSWGIS